MKPNKKVKNATPQFYDGIYFRSLAEKRIYKRLLELGYKPKYEPDKIVLQNKFRPKAAWYLEGVPQKIKNGESSMVDSLTYTPDFRLDFDGLTLYIEVKGKPNDTYPIKRKLFLEWIEKQENTILFAEIHSVSGLNKLMQNLYEREKIT